MMVTHHSYSIYSYVYLPFSALCEQNVMFCIFCIYKRLSMLDFNEGVDSFVPVISNHGKLFGVVSEFIGISH